MCCTCALPFSVICAFRILFLHSTASHFLSQKARSSLLTQTDVLASGPRGLSPFCWINPRTMVVFCTVWSLPWTLWRNWSGCIPHAGDHTTRLDREHGVLTLFSDRFAHLRIYLFYKLRKPFNPGLAWRVELAWGQVIRMTRNNVICQFILNLTLLPVCIIIHF